MSFLTPKNPSQVLPRDPLAETLANGESTVVADSAVVGRFKSNSFLNSVSYALEGMAYAIKTQRNIRIHLTCAMLALGMALILHFNILEWVVLWAVIGMVIFAELMNTALEVAMDVLSNGEYNEHVKIVKDVAAAAVLVVAICAFAIGLCLFVPHVLDVLFTTPVDSLTV